MTSFSVSNATLKKENEKILIIELSRILMWYRDDFYKSYDDVPAMLFFYLLERGTESHNLLKEFFDVLKDENYEPKKDGNGLMVWDSKFLQSALKVKKGKKYKLVWKEYDWGTNSK